MATVNKNEKCISLCIIYGLGLFFIGSILHLLLTQTSWQKLYTAVIIWLTEQISNEIIAAISVNVIVIVTVFLLILGAAVGSTIPLPIYVQLIFYLVIEFIVIFGLSLAAFFDVVFMFQYNTINENTLFYIPIFTFIVTSVLYYLIKYILKKFEESFLCSSKPFGTYSLKGQLIQSVRFEREIYSKVNMNGLLYLFVSFTTVVILADAYATSAWTTLVDDVGQKAPPTFEDFLNTRIYRILIPAISVYLLSIYAELRNGLRIKK